MMALQLALAGTSTNQNASGLNDPVNVAIILAVVIAFILLFIFRERQKRNKYDPNKIKGKVWTRWGPWSPDS